MRAPLPKETTSITWVGEDLATLTTLAKSGIFGRGGSWKKLVRGLGKARSCCCSEWSSVRSTSDARFGFDSVKASSCGPGGSIVDF